MGRPLAVLVYYEGNSRGENLKLIQTGYEQSEEHCCKEVVLLKKEITGAPTEAKEAANRIERTCFGATETAIFVFLDGPNDKLLYNYLEKGFVAKILKRVLSEASRSLIFVVDDDQTHEDLKITYEEEEKIRFMKYNTIGNDIPSSVREIKRCVLELVNNRGITIPRKGHSRTQSFNTPPNFNYFPPMMTYPSMDPPEDVFSASTEDTECPMIDPSKSHLVSFVLQTYDDFERQKYLEPRFGTRNDIKNMEKFFVENLKFTNHENPRELTAEKTLAYFKEKAEEIAKEKPELIIVVISTHGEERIEGEVHQRSASGTATRSKEKKHFIYCYDKEVVETKDVINAFQIHALKNVQKVFLIQACSSVSGDKGDPEDHGTTLQVVEDKSCEKQSTNASTEESFDVPDAKGRRMGGPIVQLLPREIPKDFKEQGPLEEVTVNNNALAIDVPKPTANNNALAIDVPKLMANNNALAIPKPETRKIPVGHEHAYLTMGGSTERSDILSVQMEKITTQTEDKEGTKVHTHTEERTEALVRGNVIYRRTKTCDIDTEVVTEVPEVEASIQREEADNGECLLYCTEPCPNDSLVVFASASGKYAYHHEKTGGWLFHFLDGVLQEKLEHSKLDLLEVLTEVANKMASREVNLKGRTDTLKNSPCIHYRLRKDLIINLAKQKYDDDLN